MGNLEDKTNNLICWKCYYRLSDVCVVTYGLNPIDCDSYIREYISQTIHQKIYKQEEL